MATTTQPKGRSKIVHKSAVEQIGSLLQQLPKKEKQELPLGEAIAELAETIQATLAKGYNYKELSDILSDKLEVSVSVWSLKRYLSAAIKGESSTSSIATKLKRGRKAKAAEPGETVARRMKPFAAEAVLDASPDELVEAEAAAPEPATEAPTLAKKRGTRGRSTQSAQSQAVAEISETAPAKKRGTRTKTATAAQPDAGVKTTSSRGRRKAI